MKVAKFTVADAPFERAPGQGGDVYLGNVLDEKDGGPRTREIMDTLGHSQETMTNLYAHVVPELQRRTMDRMDERFGTQSRPRIGLFSSVGPTSGRSNA